LDLSQYIQFYLHSIGNISLPWRLSHYHDNGQHLFKEHAWKQYQQQHPAKAKQYQTLYPSYQVIKKCVDEIKAEQQMKLRQEQQLKAKQHAPKMKSRGMSR